jgi:hypothetical protein
MILIQKNMTIIIVITTISIIIIMKMQKRENLFGKGGLNYKINPKSDG